MYLVVEVWYFEEALVSINAILQHLCSHVTVNDSDCCLLFGFKLGTYTYTCLDVQHI